MVWILFIVIMSGLADQCQSALSTDLAALSVAESVEPTIHLRQLQERYHPSSQWMDRLFTRVEDALKQHKHEMAFSSSFFGFLPQVVIPEQPVFDDRRHEESEKAQEEFRIACAAKASTCRDEDAFMVVTAHRLEEMGFVVARITQGGILKPKASICIHF